MSEYGLVRLNLDVEMGVGTLRVGTIRRVVEALESGEVTIRNPFDDEPIFLEFGEFVWVKKPGGGA